MKKRGEEGEPLRWKERLREEERQMCSLYSKEFKRDICKEGRREGKMNVRQLRRRRGGGGVEKERVG